MIIVGRPYTHYMDPKTPSSYKKLNLRSLRETTQLFILLLHSVLHKLICVCACA